MFNACVLHLYSGSLLVMTANNDAQVRVFDAGNFACLSCFSFPWSVNVGRHRNPSFLISFLTFSIFHQLCILYVINGFVIHPQNTSVSPEGKLMAVLGDSAECLVADAESGKVDFYFYLLLSLFVFSFYQLWKGKKRK